MALIKYRLNNKWVVIPITATEISPDLIINSSQISISNIDSSASGDVASGDSLSVAVSKLVNKIKKVEDIDLSVYYTKEESDSRYVQIEEGKGLSTNDFTTSLKNKLESLNNYTLPAATSTELGGVKVGSGINLSDDGTISVTPADLSPYITADQIDNTYVKKEEGKGLSTNDFTNVEKEKLQSLENYTLPIATIDSLGGIKIGSGINIDGDGTISVNMPDLSPYITADQIDNSYVKKEAGKGLSTNDFTTAEKEKLQSLENYVLPIASVDSLGGIKIGSGINLGSDGTISVTPTDLGAYITAEQIESTYVKKEDGKGLSTNDFTTAEKEKLQSLENYTLPIASVDSLGGIKVGSGLRVDNYGTLSAVITSTGDLDLSNYYTKDQVDSQISTIPKFSINPVDTLPVSNISNTTIYLLKDADADSDNLFTEYIYVNNKWEILGAQKVNLDPYLTKEDASSTYVTKEQYTSEKYVLPVSSASILGGVKIGTGINVTQDGTISVPEVDLSDYYTKEEVNNTVSSTIADTVQVTYYTVEEIDALFEAAEATLPDADEMQF